ncbi:carbohydrate esterase family 8 protein [Tulasnella calospora MUT 4182]|uniref:Carbohydrate esterase family 8 protein n=1 Tax=Tulasnella calospora MUT 4182 TaxID=1051891 RepID=A0A0C3KMG7_9AGAM|nr:carbohydrate esterase family 8 protein [Tulasnella calospora MUT 4182]
MAQMARNVKPSLPLYKTSPSAKDGTKIINRFYVSRNLASEQSKSPEDQGKATPVWSATTFSPSPPAITLSELNPNDTKQSLPCGPTVPNTQLGHEYSLCWHSCNQHAYPVRKYDASSEKQQIGLLRVINEDEIGIPQYYSVEEEILHIANNYSYSHANGTTPNRREALIVSFLPIIGAPSTRMLELKRKLEKPCHFLESYP